MGPYPIVAMKLNKIPTLRPHCIHVWRADLEAVYKRSENFPEVLSLQEQERAGRFVFDKDRRRFAACRRLLRYLLSGYTGFAPHQVMIDYNPYGKPRLAGDQARSGCLFNLSHSAGRALLAFSASIPVGIDLEKVRPGIDCAAIAEDFFSPEEFQALMLLNESERLDAFFGGWTRKEAFIKGAAKGLSLGLDQFVVTLGPKEPVNLLETKYDPQEAAYWSLYQLEGDPGFKAALAVRSSRVEIERFEAADWLPD